MDVSSKKSSGSFELQPSRSRLRLALLGCVAMVAVGGILVDVRLAPNPLYAATLQTTAPLSFADIVDHVKGAVVSVKVNVVDAAAETGDGALPDLPFPKGSPMERLFRQFNEQNAPVKPHGGQALGSGFFISADGYIVTNNHVVENGKTVSVTTDDGKSYDAKLIGVDKKTDLALLKVKSGGNFPFVSFASHAPRIGDWVLAVGNPFGLGGTVTAGIVSARGRDIGAGPYDDFLQIDAPVNRGNSGGPTFNTEGEVVGVNTAIFSPSGGSVGIGFAIPADTVKDVVFALREKGTVARSWIGVQIQPVSDEIAESLGLKSSKGALISEPQKDGPAAAAGLKSGDVIVSVNAELIDGPRELARKISALAPEHPVEIGYIREGVTKTASIKLAPMPTDPQQASLEMPDAAHTVLSAFGLKVAPARSVDGAGQAGLVIADIEADGAAAQKGLHVGDVIVEAAGKPLSRPSDLVAVFDQAKKDGRKAVLLRVKSGENLHFVALATQPTS